MNPKIIATICPNTVAAAAPAMPIFGKPNSPKIKIGSKIRLITAPVVCVIIVQTVRPVACKSRSKQNCPYSPKLHAVTIHR